MQNIHMLASTASGAIQTRLRDRLLRAASHKYEGNKFTLKRAFRRIAILWLWLDSSWRVCSAASFSATLLPSTKTSGGRSARRASSIPGVLHHKQKKIIMLYMQSTIVTEVLGSAVHDSWGISNHNLLCEMVHWRTYIGMSFPNLWRMTDFAEGSDCQDNRKKRLMFWGHLH